MFHETNFRNCFSFDNLKEIPNHHGQYIFKQYATLFSINCSLITIIHNKSCDLSKLNFLIVNIFYVRATNTCCESVLLELIYYFMFLENLHVGKPIHG